jgi:hypothetical protein
MPEETANNARRPEDIALDLMKFVAVTTGYGKPGTGAGFQSKSEGSGEAYADSLLKLYERCRAAVGKH